MTGKCHIFSKVKLINIEPAHFEQLYNAQEQISGRMAYSTTAVNMKCLIFLKIL